jgi:hypothetical protein
MDAPRRRKKVNTSQIKKSNSYDNNKDTQMTLELIISIVSTLIAAMAFLFSGYTLYLQRIDLKPKLIISDPTSIPRITFKNKKRHAVILYLISNTGQNPIYLHEIFLYTRKDGFLLPLKVNKLKLPHKMDAGEILEVNSILDNKGEDIIRKSIKSGNTEAFIVLHDGTWNEFKSNIFRLNIDDESVVSHEPVYSICPNHPEKPGFYSKINIYSQ